MRTDYGAVAVNGLNVTAAIEDIMDWIIEPNPRLMSRRTSYKKVFPKKNSRLKHCDGGRDESDRNTDNKYKNVDIVPKNPSSQIKSFVEPVGNPTDMLIIQRRLVIRPGCFPYLFHIDFLGGSTDRQFCFLSLSTPKSDISRYGKDGPAFSDYGRNIFPSTHNEYDLEIQTHCCSRRLHSVASPRNGYNFGQLSLRVRNLQGHRAIMPRSFPPLKR